MPRSLTSYARWGIAGLAGVVVALILLVPDMRDRFLSGDGTAKGAIIAAIALGVVLTYRGSGVVNFANGAIAMYAAYVYTELRNNGDLFLPPLPNPFAVIEGVVHWFQSTDSFELPDWPTNLSFGGPMSFWVAMPIALVFCILFGLAIHALIFKPLRDAPILAKVVASAGLLLLLQAIVVRRFATTPRSVKPLPFVDKDQVDLGIMKITEEGLFVAGLVVVFAILLWLLFQRTRFGLATRAAAENERGAIVLGFSPDLLAAVNWVLATVITGLLGIFVASIDSNINPLVLPGLIVPALTAALVGGFQSFAWTTFAAFVLGMQFPLIQYVGTTRNWFPKSGTQPVPGVSYLIPLLVIVAVLFLRGNALPERGAVSVGRLPFAPTPPRWAVRYGGPGLAIAAALAGLFWFDPAYRGALANSLVGTIICLSIVVITGFVGQISLSQMAFAGISGFAVSKLSMEHGWPFPWPIIVGATVALGAGILVALPALRVRGVNLAIVTLACAVTADELVFKNQSVNGGLLGAKVDGPDWIDPNRPSTYEILGFTAGDGKLPNPMTAMFCLIVVVVVAYAVTNLRRSTTGRQMLAVRSNERAAAAAGVSVSGTKMLAFAISAFIAGIGGAVIAYRSGGVTADRFTFLQSIVFFAFAYLGGISSVAGAVVGGLLVAGGLGFTFLEKTMGVPSEFVLLLGGLGLIVTAILNPDGQAGRIASEFAKLRRRFSGRSAPDPTAEPPQSESTLEVVAGS